MSAPVSATQRFHSKRNPCPVCGGGSNLPSGKGARCYGFLSEDGKWAHCSRQEYAGPLSLDQSGTAYAHRLEGSCKCGMTHGAASPPPPPRPPERKRIYPESRFAGCPRGGPWDYTALDGSVLYRESRHGLTGFYHRNGTGWVAGRGAAPRVLFDLPKVRKAIEEGRTIYLCEGPKKARMLLALGLAATSNDCGADGFAKEHAEGLRGAPRVVVVLDNDAKGKRRAESVPPMLQSEGVADVRILLPEVPDNQGIDDWLNARKGKGKTRGGIRAEIDALVDKAPRWNPPPCTERTGEHSPVAPPADSAPADAALPAGRKGGTPWDAAQDVHDFLASSEPEGDWLVPLLIMRGAVTMWFSPRGLGKTLVAHWIAAGLARSGKRVLLIDRDNPRREVRRRLRAWGLGDLGAGLLKIIHRDKAPPLTDAKAWASFPVGDYDLVILDSFDSSAEGVGEQDSSKTSTAVAALLDVVRGTAGPAALILGNTTKSGAHGRGSGVLEDRLDIIYEVRDATGLKPSGTKDWWHELPASGRDAWGDRASRRKRRDEYRLAFVATKFRVGEEPDPFAFEVGCAGEPWTCTEVTADLVSAGEQSVIEAARAETLKRDEAAKALGEALTGTGLALNEDAIPFLEERGLSRKAARELIEQRAGVDWVITGVGRKGDPRMVSRSEALEKRRQEIGGPPEPHEQRALSSPIPAVGHGSGRQESATTKPATDAAPAGVRIPAVHQRLPRIPDPFAAEKAQVSARWDTETATASVGGGHA